MKFEIKKLLLTDKNLIKNKTFEVHYYIYHILNTLGFFFKQKFL